MIKITFEESDFVANCITMLMGLDKLEINTQTLCLIEMMKHLEGGGYVVKATVYPKLKQSMGITKPHFAKLLERLELGEHITVSNGIIYPNPKYTAIATTAQGNLLITTKKK